MKFDDVITQEIKECGHAYCENQQILTSKLKNGYLVG